MSDSASSYSGFVKPFRVVTDKPNAQINDDIDVNASYTYEMLEYRPINSSILTF